MKNNVHSDTSKKKSKFLSALSFPLLVHLAQFNSLDASIPSTDPDDLVIIPEHVIEISHKNESKYE
jgi:hypothetical protein